jgi:hypothetical protein
MMLELSPATFGPSLKWKRGEYEGLASVDEALKDRILPHIVVMPLSERDIEHNRRLTNNEFAAVQVGRLSKHWGRRACLVDTRLVEFGSSWTSDARRLGAFLTAATKFGCGVLPVFDLNTSEYRLQAIREHWLATKHGLGLRLTLSDLQRQRLGSVIGDRLLKVVAKPMDFVLILDLSEAELSNAEEFSTFTLDWIFRLQQIGQWNRILVQATNYPERNPAIPNRSAKISRQEWMIWRRVVELDPRVREIAMFGDFGADNATMNFGGGGAPITHLRYATEKEWLIVRGGPPSEKGDGSIRQAAREIIGSGAFNGEQFSLGDEFIAGCASGDIPVGGPTDWRRANMSHHLTRVAVDASALNGVAIQPTPRPLRTRQEDLFTRNLSPSDTVQGPATKIRGGD